MDLAEITWTPSSLPLPLPSLESGPPIVKITSSPVNTTFRKSKREKKRSDVQRKLAVLCRRCHAGATRALHEESNTESPDIVQARKGVRIRGGDLHLRNDQHTLRLQHHPSSYAKSTVTPSCSRTKHDLYPTLLKMRWEEGRCRTSASGASHHHTTLLPFTANRCKHNGCY